MSYRLHFLNVGIASSAAYLLYPKSEDQNKSIKQIYKIEKPTNLLKHIKAKYGIPGLSIAVSVNGELVWTEGFGYSDVENLVECSPDTVYRIASISKSITTAIVAKLWSNGKLSLDDPISKYNVNFPTKFIEGKECVITCRNIMSHSSGIRHYKNDEEFYITKKFNDISSAMNIFKDDDLLFYPGTKANYSTYAWTLLAAVCESVSQKKFTTLLRELFEDLRMDNTYLEDHSPLILNRTRYYSLNNREMVNSPYSESTHKYAGGGILSTVGDIVKFGNEMLRGYFEEDGYLGQETMRELWTRQFNHNANKYFGLGWFIYDHPQQHKYIYHTGGAAGCSSIILLIPSNINGVVVCIMANRDNVSLLKTAKQIGFYFANQI